MPFCDWMPYEDIWWVLDLTTTGVRFYRFRKSDLFLERMIFCYSCLRSWRSEFLYRFWKSICSQWNFRSDHEMLDASRGRTPRSGPAAFAWNNFWLNPISCFVFTCMKFFLGRRIGGNIQGQNKWKSFCEMPIVWTPASVYVTILVTNNILSISQL